MMADLLLTESAADRLLCTTRELVIEGESCQRSHELWRY
jgi:hypothetical protein